MSDGHRSANPMLTWLQKVYGSSYIPGPIERPDTSRNTKVNANMFALKRTVLTQFSCRRLASRRRRAPDRCARRMEEVSKKGWAPDMWRAVGLRADYEMVHQYRVCRWFSKCLFQVITEVFVFIDRESDSEIVVLWLTSPSRPREVVEDGGLNSWVHSMVCCKAVEAPTRLLQRLCSGCWPQARQRLAVVPRNWLKIRAGWGVDCCLCGFVCGRLLVLCDRRDGFILRWDVFHYPTQPLSTDGIGFRDFWFSKTSVKIFGIFSNFSNWARGHWIFIEIDF